MDKKQENNLKERAYSMLGETIIELKKNDEECKKIAEFRAIYLNLRLEIREAQNEKRKLDDTVEFEFNGSAIEYNKYKRVLNELIPEFEDALSKMYNKKIQLNYFRIKKANKIIFTLQEA